MAGHPVTKLTEQEYLALDRANEFRSEYVDGEMLAMSGGTLRHSALAVDLAFLLKLKLAGRGCRVLNSDTRVRTAVSGAYLYPDLSVVCGEIRMLPQTADTLLNPVMVAEVLSPSARNYDEGSKFSLYREIEPLQDYLLVHSDMAKVCLYSRTSQRLDVSGGRGDGRFRSYSFSFDSYCSVGTVQRSYEDPNPGHLTDTEAMASQPVTKLTEEEYLALERASEFRSEYVDGEMLAMAGGTLRHSSLALLCASELGKQLEDRDCLIFNSDAKVRTSRSRSYVYPDVSVVCGDVLVDHNDILLNPVMVVEVLSPSTRQYDQSRKFELYREIESMKEYLLVDSVAVKVELYSRQTDDSWNFREAIGMEADMYIPALSVTLQLEKIFESAMRLPA